MVIITIIAALILIFSFFGGLTQGLVKSFFSLATFLISVPVAGLYYKSAASWLGFIHNQNWQHFLGFFIIMCISSIILSIIFFLPRKIIDNIIPKFIVLNVVGGLLNLLGSVMGLIVLGCLINAFPVWEWLRSGMNDSGLISWLMSHFALTKYLLPEILRVTAKTI
jgi:uncharacterized membrane protein required for colicin V production